MPLAEHQPEADGHEEDHDRGDQDGEGVGQLSVAVKAADEQVRADDLRWQEPDGGSLEFWEQ
ncbi:MAG: hypothetical protein HOY79_14480 [Streptomyces sp.]|nr:hypothetical protein [Streptomyces sp.]